VELQERHSTCSSDGLGDEVYSPIGATPAGPTLAAHRAFGGRLPLPRPATRV